MQLRSSSATLSNTVLTRPRTTSRNEKLKCSLIFCPSCLGKGQHPPKSASSAFTDASFLGAVERFAQRDLRMHNYTGGRIKANTPVAVAK
ncbi:hypothetical protein CY34DRAFT_805265 [Suillus luteus UH-Slu-Lm8-n1]|uniref:Uncharacterized protein n=1 Tax=Suillus luteus UH-Slu-Lm8-n1 TaxID=930992 RepID=A0A0D0BFR7_9AGAM|nr:hypothetical protein CY34DRAFT_805265 [Suillus luteus UH-Slu-Lm8-n1]